MIFGGFAIQIIRNLGGDISEIYALDFMKVRSDEKNEIFYYSDDWGKWGSKCTIYPVYRVGDSNPTSIYYNKGTVTRGVYPTPLYGAALIACELEKSINEFHINNINNGFASNVIINFNNGVPSDEDKEEAEKDIQEKFTGYQNAGRFLLSFNDSAENATTIERLNGDDFDDKYSALADRSRNQIFTAFRANPILFGLNPENDGFNQVEFESAYRLFNKTVVQPLQSEIELAFEKIFDKDALKIEPFKIQWENEQG